MTYAIGLQMEPFETLDTESSTSFLLAVEAKKRGFKLFHFTPESVSFLDSRVFAWMRSFDLEGNKVIYGEYERTDLTELDAVLMRQDQPYSLKYLTNCHLLERIHPITLVLNDPRYVQKTADKWFVTRFPEIIPPTLISSDAREIKAFRNEHKNIMLKPLYSHHGEGKYHVTPESENLDSYLEMFSTLYGQAIIAQQYIGRIDNCDRRIIMVDGKPIGAYDRIAAPKESRATIASGAIATKAEMSRRDHEICEIVGPTLHKLGIVLASIDVIGDYMIEIDVNSPVGMPYIDKFDGINSAAIFWNAVEERLG